MRWFIDNSVDLTGACEAGDWHPASVMEKLREQGLSQADAEAYTYFAFEEAAVARDADPEDYVSNEQWERLSVRAVTP